MKKITKLILTLIICGGLIIPLYAQPSKELCKENISNSTLIQQSVTNYLKNERYEPVVPQKNKFSIIRLFKSKAFAAEKNTRTTDYDRNKIREEWSEFLGLDVFYPYFKAKEIEDYVQQKSAVKLFNLKGKAEFSKDYHGVKYIFKRKF